MKTRDLVTLLAQAEPNKPMMTLGAVATYLVVLCALCTKLFLGLRPELTAMTIPMSFCFKTTVLATLVVLSLQALKSSATPLGRFKVQHLAWGLGVVMVVALIYEWVSTPLNDIGHLFLLPNFPSCLTYVTLYSCGMSLALVSMVKKMAPLHYERTAGLIGLTSACISALGYSIHCPIDSPTFIIVAYGLPQIALYVASRLVLPRFLRW